MTDQQPQPPETPSRRMNRLLRETSPRSTRGAMAAAIRKTWARKGGQQ